MTDINYTDIYNTYSPKLKVLFNKQLKDKDYADDLIQETLLKVYNKLDTYDSKYSISTWIYTIAFNTLKNYYKALKDNISYSAEIYENEHTVSLDNPEDIMIAAESEQKFMDSVDNLDPQFLEAYTLKEVDGLSYKDIASQLGIPEGTAKSRVKRARDYIKKEVL